MAKGFVLRLNLEESNTRDKDELALDNLGGSGISNDIGLFSNNLRNFDFINPEDIDTTTESQVLSILPNSNKIAFSNRNIVTHNGVQYTVVDSDSNKKFSLIDGAGNYLLSNQVTHPMNRSLAVTFDNLKNINPKKIKVLNAPLPLIENLFSLQQRGIINYGLEVQSIYSSPIIDYVNTANDLASDFNLIRTKTLFSSIDNVKNDEFVTYNSIFVVNKNNDDITLENTPGIYIKSGEGQIARVGGSNVDPWETLPGRTITQSSQTNLRNLKTNNLELKGVIAVEPIGSPADVRTAFTHKMECIINGQVFNLLCELDPT